MAYDLTEFERGIFETYAIGRAYLAYYDELGGPPLPLTMPVGYPPGVMERGGPIAVYRECIKKGVTWEKLLDIKAPPDGVII